jgi:uncharacterized protein YigA (DUF484 family)
MAGEPDGIAPPRRAPLTDADVTDYLRRHPDFLVRHPELATVLTPPSHQRGGGVIDLQRFMIDRARAEMAAVRAERDNLVALSRSNLSGQGQIHKAVLALLGARDFEDFVHLLTTDLGMYLGVDVVTLCVEADRKNCPRSETAGVYALPEGTVASLVGDGGKIVLKAAATGDPLVFGAGAELVRSFALIPLAFGKCGRIGLLALGARRPNAFTPKDGTELLNFLGRVVELSVRKWLGLPD